MNCCTCAKSIPDTAWTIDADGNLVSVVCADCVVRRPTEASEIVLSDGTTAQVNGYGSRHRARRASMYSPAEPASFDSVEIVIDGRVVDRSTLGAADDDRVWCAVEHMVEND